MIFFFLHISLKSSKFLLNLILYKALFIWNIVSFGSIMFAQLKHSIKFIVPNILAFVDIKL